MKTRVLRGMTDILVGLVSLALFLAIDSYLHVAADMRKGLLVSQFFALRLGSYAELAHHQVHC
jgi:hypothetical protein